MNDKDPIPVSRKSWSKAAWPVQELEGIKADVKKELDAALEFAQSSPLPELTALLEDVYANRNPPRRTSWPKKHICRR